MSINTGSVAAVLLSAAPSGVDLQSAVDDVTRAGAHPVVIVLARDTPAPSDARVARVKVDASWITCVRTGMALLANTPAHLALVATLSNDPRVDDASLAALISAAHASGAAVTAIDPAALAHGPIVVARDAWLDLLTLGQQGIDAVVARRGVHYLR